MTRSERLLLISSVRWGYLWQRHQALAAAAAADGWAVDFLEPHPRRAAQILRYLLDRLRGRFAASHAVAPPPGVSVLGQSAWLRPGDRYDAVLCYVPDRASARRIRRSGADWTVYDAVLDWAAVPRSWYPPIGWRSAERRLARLASAVTTDSAGMQAVLRARGIPAEVVHPAADDAFLTSRAITPRPRTAVYFGALRAEVDTRVLVALVAAGIEVTAIGTVDDPALGRELEEAGVRLEPPQSVDALAASVASFQFVLLPYRGERSATLVPAKLWNCLASGRWVIASGLALTVEAPNLVAVPGDPQQAVRAVLDRLDAEDPSGPERPPTWSERWERIRSLPRH